MRRAFLALLFLAAPLAGQEPPDTVALPPGGLVILPPPVPDTVHDTTVVEVPVEVEVEVPGPAVCFFPVWSASTGLSWTQVDCPDDIDLPPDTGGVVPPEPPDSSDTEPPEPPPDNPGSIVGPPDGWEQIAFSDFDPTDEGGFRMKEWRPARVEYLTDATWGSFTRGHFEPGDPDGAGPSKYFRENFGGQDQLYVRAVVRHSADYVNGPTGANKVIHFNVSTGLTSRSAQITRQGGRWTVRMSHFGCGGQCFPNAGTPAEQEYELGVWHQLEVLIDVPSRTVRYWLDGALVIDISDATVDPIRAIELDNTWGGQGNNVPSSFYVDWAEVDVWAPPGPPTVATRWLTTPVQPPVTSTAASSRRRCGGHFGGAFA